MGSPKVPPQAPAPPPLPDQTDAVVQGRRLSQRRAEGFRSRFSSLLGGESLTSASLLGSGSFSAALPRPVARP